MNVKIINHSKNDLPSYATEGSAGMDLRANLEQDVTLQPMQRAMIPTGLILELPQGVEAQVRPRSGLSLKRGLTVVNAPGTIDSDYRGYVGILLINLSKEPQIIRHGDRVAQMVIARHERVVWESAEAVSETDRGDGGFGSTGN